MLNLEEIRTQYLAFQQTKLSTGEPQDLYEVFPYLLDGKGKMLRPILTISAYLLNAEWNEEILPLAMAFEQFHNFSLVHDDIMDNGETRRGKASFYKYKGQNTAILAGDLMLVKCYELIQNLPQNHIKTQLQNFNFMATKVCEGQQMDMNFEIAQFQPSVEDYITMIRYKTAELFAACLKGGFILANGSRNFANKLYNSAISAGIAFQIIDDIIDAFGEETMTGKKRGGDILEGKKTILHILLLQKINETQKLDYLSIFNNSSEQKVTDILNLYKQYNIEKDARKLADSYYQQALKELGLVNGNNDAKETIELLYAKLFKRNK